MSSNYLITQFRKEMNMTPLNYLRKVRMENASSLLLSTEYSIQEISVMVGIMDANYFVKLFKKNMVRHRRNFGNITNYKL